MSSAGLRDRLAELEAEHATLRAELSAFESEYLREVGIVMAELHELEARILALVAVRSGTADDARAADAARDRARETTTAIRSIPPPAGPPPTADLKALFRDAAKRMHPDLVPDGSGRRHAEAFMKRLNAAYRAGDADLMRDLVRQWETSPLAGGSASGADGEERILRVAVAEAERRLEAARATELSRVMERSLLAAMEGRDHLAELKLQFQAAVAAARVLLAELEREPL